MTAQATSALEPVDREVDARDPNSPLPILRTQTALNCMVTGQTRRILTTEPGSVRDFRACCRQSGNELVGEGERDGAFWFVVRRR